MNLPAVVLVALFCLLLTESAAQAANTSELIVLARISERLIVAASGAFSLWLGYRLFEAITEKQRQAIESVAALPTSPDAVAAGRDERRSALEAKLGDVLNIRVSDVGPGVFFALFGSVLLGYVMYSSVDLKSPEVMSAKPFEAPKQDAKAVGPNIRFENPDLRIRIGDRDKLLESVKAVRTLETYQVTADTTEAGKQKIAEALRSLSSAKAALVDLGFGEGSFAKYQLLKVKSPDELAKQTKEELDRFYSIDGLMNGGL
ncbi:hypothetical protein HZZ13_08725 [Bradyrhizobium sp. CNPSo 4010]|uniref:Uncharacterized protein n=1 Tax=Bradyrhizobium agreste TaxID=2751811 RepID=A0ABS0PKX6_9BRAD|nr:hypothetical protein [Bradyrhizobium agreste]MBH5397875.1 hypothetical protein [Bradyrhizobium agreste]